jgi:hypothetical protein
MQFSRGAIALLVCSALGCADLRDRPILRGAGGAGGLGPREGTGGAGGGPFAGAGGSGGSGGLTRDGPNSLPPPADLSAFLGLWEFSQGATVHDCDPAGPTTRPATGTFQLQRGVDAPLWYVEGHCMFRLDVANDVATYRTSHGCTYTEANLIYAVVPISGTIQVSGRDGVIQAAFSVTIRSPTATTTCRLDLDAKTTKVPEGGGPG